MGPNQNHNKGALNFAYTRKVYQLAPEDGWLEDDFPFWKLAFQGLC